MLSSMLSFKFQSKTWRSYNQRSFTQSHFNLHSQQSTIKNLYTDTLKLPRTPFPLRQSDPIADEVQLRERTTKRLWEWQNKQSDRPVWTLHDGPPYANGPLHMGHTLNKILKDIINRVKLLNGNRINYLPGFDCHGLPLELKAVEALRDSSEINQSDPITIRSLARQAADTGVKLQTKEFERLSILTDWSKAWRTMDPKYEIQQIRLFAKMLENDYIYRSSKPVYFSPSSGTALAEAEIEYNEDHLSLSVYATFDVVRPSKRLAELLKDHNSKSVKLVVWTTTPWTLVANQAVALSSDDLYSIVKDFRSSSSDELLIFATSRLTVLQEILGSVETPLEVVGELTGHELSSTSYTHDFTISELPTFVAQHVTMKSGSGLVHTAPSHGQDDFYAYNSSMANHGPLKYIDVVDDLGRFKIDGEKTIWMEQLNGKEVLYEGNRHVITMLRHQNRLLGEVIKIRHKYPYDWRTKKPVITKITPQWFISLEKIRPLALASLSQIQFHPERARTRLESFFHSRSEWCISRQRPWGVPIPVLYDMVTNLPLLTTESILHIANVLEIKGTDHWWQGPVQDFIPPGVEGSFRKSTDTMDVWLDSGMSWLTLEDEKADLVLEGSDQHRGWFQSLLWTSIACQKDSSVAVYRSVVTHGFILDKNGRKMSKSLGNVISPMDVLDGNLSVKRPRFGIDVLRWWASSVDFTKDVSITFDQLGCISETCRKLRSTARFLLGNAFPDCSPAASDQISMKELGLIERYALHVVYEFYQAVISAYNAMSFNQVVQLITEFRVNTLSAFYFEVSKDTLYNDAEKGADRQNVVYVMSQILNVYRFALAPILPHLAEEISLHMKTNNKGSLEGFSIFCEQWPALPESWQNPFVHEQMTRLLCLRTTLQAELELLRKEKKITVASEVEVVFDFSGCEASRTPVMADLIQHTDLLPRLFGLSDVSICKTFNAAETVVNLASPAWRHVIKSNTNSDESPFRLVLLPAWRSKCSRCWNYAAENEDELCMRCIEVLSSTVPVSNVHAT
ncbi:tRNA synthetases class I-domain-containing protein [Melampsora americana]|nr:tRNA synthetases class I-domain-containing protein [Melampsora americana]